MIRENYGQIRKKSKPVPGEFYVGKQERREGKKSGKYMEQVRKSEQEKQEDADDTEEPDIKWRILQVLLGILLPAVPGGCISCRWNGTGDPFENGAS